MKNIEEELWNYLDGLGADEERANISYLIVTDKAYQQKYEELLSFNNELENMELEAPPMAFTYNVMETIRTQEASKPLKAAINPRIITCIAAFFVISILLLLVIALANAHWDANANGIKNMIANLHLPALKIYNGAALKGFLFFDIVLALYLFDGYLRKRKTGVEM